MTMLLTGCIGKKDSSDTGAYGTANPEVKGTLNLSSYTPDTLNPLATQYSCVRDFLHLAYEGLFVVNEDLSVSGVLAESYEASEGNTVFRINLKKGVKFHDGTAFTAKDVVASFDYVRLYSTYYKDSLSGVASYREDGDYAVEISLESPRANFVCNLDFPILPSGIKEYEFGSDTFEINGTGRYRYKKTNPYVSLILNKNTSWHKKDNIYIPEVCIRFVNDNDAMLYAFDSGETDIITTDRARWGEFSYTGNYKAYEVTTSKYMFVGINTANSVFSDLEMRKSLASLLDKNDIVDTIMFSHAIQADTPISSKAYFYRSDDSGKMEYDSSYMKDKDIDKIYILYNEEDKSKGAIAVYIQRELEALGINAQLSAVDYDTYVSKIATGDYQLYIGKVDIKRDCDLSFMFDSVTASAHSGDDTVTEQGTYTVVNTSDICDFADAKLDDIINNINSAKDADSMKTAYNNLKKFYDSNLPQIPLVHINDAIFVNSRIKGALKPNLTNFYADIGGIYIE